LELKGEITNMSENINDKNEKINDISDNVNDINENIIEGENSNSNEVVSDSYENNSEVIEESIMVNVPNEEVEVKENEEVYMALGNTDFVEVKSEEVKKKGGMRNRIASYILVGAICSTLAGVGSSIATINMMKDTSSSNTVATSKVTTAKSSSDGKAKLIADSGTESLSVVEIAKKVSPSVVAISTSASATTKSGWQTTPTEGVGTGIIFSEDGYVLTNYHVISGAQNIKVMLSDGKEVSAKVVNYDAAADVAVIKLAENTKVPGVAQFGDSDALEVGESVVAIGNPLGKEFIGSVTAGVVSAVNRQVNIENKDLKFIQTDAAINPGNSGGPLVNSKGQVIGINTAKIRQEGVEGLGFSIPINSVNPKMDSLVKPILKIGISCKDITEEASKEYNIPVGVYVSEIQKASAAEKAGIMPGDIIVQFDGQKVKTVEELNKLKGTHKASDVVKIELVRNSKTIKLDLTLSE
jgi:serine protease Do